MSYLETVIFQEVFYWQYYPYDALFITCCSLSVVGSAFILGISIRSNHFRLMLGNIIFWIMFGDLMFSFPKFIGSFKYQKSGIYCSVLQVFSSYGLISTGFWACFFGHSLLMIAKDQSVERVEKWMPYHKILGIGLPSLYAVSLLFTDYIVYDPSLGCVHPAPVGEIDKTFIAYGTIPISICWGFSVMWYILAICELRKLLGEGKKNEALTWMLYPIIRLICWTPNLVTSCFLIAGVQVNPALIRYFQALGHLQGFFDAIVYGGSMQVVREKVAHTTRLVISVVSMSGN